MKRFCLLLALLLALATPAQATNVEFDLESMFDGEVYADFL